MEGVPVTDGVAVGERVGCGVPEDTELVGVGVGVGVGVRVAAGGAVVRAGSGDVDGCTVVEELPPAGGGTGLKSA